MKEFQACELDGDAGKKKKKVKAASESFNDAKT